MAFIKDNPPPATIILISGDRDFAYLLSTIRWRKYNVVLISNSFMTHESLTAQASVTYDWQCDILKVRPLSKPPLPRPRRETLSSVASLTTPQELDNSHESGAHAVGLPNEHIPPAAQPLTLSPRPASIATISTTRPTHIIIPPDVPPAEPEVTPIPPMAETPAESSPASIPRTPTPDDQTVADFASESPIVRLSVAHDIVTDPIFQQDQSPPEMVDLVDEDGAYSPAFVSTSARMYPTPTANFRILELTGNDPVKGWRRHPLLPRTTASHR